MEDLLRDLYGLTFTSETHMISTMTLASHFNLDNDTITKEVTELKKLCNCGMFNSVDDKHYLLSANGVAFWLMSRNDHLGIIFKFGLLNYVYKSKRKRTDCDERLCEYHELWMLFNVRLRDFNFSR